MGDPFVDSNVFLYLLSAETEKARRAEAIIHDGGLIRVQVLSEIVAVAGRKFKTDRPVVRDVLAAVRATFTIVPLTTETHAIALRLAEVSGFNIYDALLVAAAGQAGCTVLLTEDMNSGQRISGVTIRNPFA